MHAGSHHGGDHSAVAKPLARQGQGLFKLRGVALHHGQLNSSHGLTGNAGQPVQWHHQFRQQVRPVGAQVGVFGQVLHDGVTREFGVPLPFDGVRGKTQAQKIARQHVRGQVPLTGQAPQVRTFLLATHALVEHRHVDHQGRNADARRGPGMQLVVEQAALRMVGWQQNRAVDKWRETG